MRTLPVMEIRRHLGAVLDEVRLKSETVVLERAGKPVAMLTPVDRPEPYSDQAARKVAAVREMAGLYTASPRGADVAAWLERERGDWNEGP